MNNIVISLDGHSGCGKSTLAKLIAQRLNYLYIDTGAMYRAITLFFFENNLIDKKGNLKEGYELFLNKVLIDFSKADENGKSWVRLNGEVVEKQIRTLKISNLVSQISKSPIIRNKLVSLQQAYGKRENVVMDGRDIGSVVFPKAQIKFWITASAEKRARRRYIEFRLKGEDISFEQVKENIILRDSQDQNRKVSPLIKPKNAIEIDNTDLNIDQTFDLALDYIHKYKSSHP
ncbi:MAG: (d)CMP kinase [Parvicellaceae bacterium]|tara:strand:+ start:1928 stop:2623 length:696 start_codon:yes stop_codon:yes gene_type:complete